jgi:hypothetical protein
LRYDAVRGFIKVASPSSFGTGGAALPLPVAAQISNHQSLVAFSFWCSPKEHQVDLISSLSSAAKKGVRYA